MIDPKLLRSATEDVARNLARRGYRLDVEALNELEAKRRHWQLESDRLRAERNSHAKTIGQAKGRGDDIAPLLARGEALAHEVEATDQALAACSRVERLAARPAQSAARLVPDGARSANVVVRQWRAARVGIRRLIMWRWARSLAVLISSATVSARFVVMRGAPRMHASRAIHAGSAPGQAH
jgi:seryl-tRNA synthetase